MTSPDDDLSAPGEVSALPPRPAPSPSLLARRPRPAPPAVDPAAAELETAEPATELEAVPEARPEAVTGALERGPVSDAAGESVIDAPSAGETVDPWGRVDAEGTVYLRTGEGERVVGSWQVGEPAAALEYYRGKFDGLVVEIDLLERRLRSGALPPDEATASILRIREHVDTAQVVGNLPSLQSRLDGLQRLVEARRAKRKADRARVVEAARVSKEALVAEAETIAAGSDWRVGADRLRAMLDEWKALPRLDKRADEELWRRFSTARTTYTRRRKTHYAELADKRDDAKSIKERLVSESEGLATSTEWGPTAARYRALMTQWKTAGPAPREEVGPLWQRFRAAQDAFFAARSATLSTRDSAEKESLRLKEELLSEAEALLPVTDVGSAKAKLRSIQDRWSAAGRVPRDAMTRLEGRLRAVEETVRAGEQAEWTRTSPAALARAEATVEQLHTSIAKLDKQLAAAETAGKETAAADARAALETRRAWLSEAEKTLTDLRRR